MTDGPLFVVVSGPPASGKTTLALVLAAELGLPLVAKDTIKDALWACSRCRTLRHRGNWDERLRDAGEVARFVETQRHEVVTGRVRDLEDVRDLPQGVLVAGVDDSVKAIDDWACAQLRPCLERASRERGEERHGRSPTGGRELPAGEVLLLGNDVIHSVAKSRSDFAVALHVYGGDFFSVERSE